MSRRIGLRWAAPTQPVLRSFLVTYKKVLMSTRRAPGDIEPHRAGTFVTRQAIIGPSALMIILVGAGVR